MNNRDKSTLVGALNIVPTFMLTRKLVQQVGWKGAMLPGSNIAVMRQNKVLTAVYLGLMTIQIGLVLKDSYDQLKSAREEDVGPGLVTDDHDYDEDAVTRILDDLQNMGLLNEEDRVPLTDFVREYGASVFVNPDNAGESTFPSDDIKRCEIDHLSGGPCLTPLTDDGICANAADHDTPARA